MPPLASDSACAYYNSDWDSYDSLYREFLANYFLAQIDSYE